MTLGQLRRRELVIDGVRTPLLEAGPPAAPEAAVFVHGNPGSSTDFEHLVTAAGAFGRAVAWDAPGFGRADAPASFPQTVAGHAGFLGRVLDGLEIERAHLVLHDFGGPWGLHWAASAPERLASATLIDTGVLLDYRWHALARIWRTPVVGEVVTGTASRPSFRLLLRRGNPRGLPRHFVDRMYDDFDRATRRAVLRLYRSHSRVAEHGRELADALAPLDRPALVIWGRSDPYLHATLADRQREAFPSAIVRVLDDSGHWPFVDAREQTEALVLAFLADRLAATRARESAALAS